MWKYFSKIAYNLFLGKCLRKKKSVKQVCDLAGQNAPQKFLGLADLVLSPFSQWGYIYIIPMFYILYLLLSLHKCKPASHNSLCCFLTLVTWKITIVCIQTMISFESEYLLGKRDIDKKNDYESILFLFKIPNGGVGCKHLA